MMGTGQRPVKPLFKARLAAVVALGVLGYCFAVAVSPRGTNEVVGAAPDNSADLPLPLAEISPGSSANLDPMQPDYSRFLHQNPAHSRLPCLLCHRRDDQSTRLRFPGKPDHLPCASCHTAQFSDASSPMCSICHTDPGTGSMRGFPSLQTFNVRFDHARHGSKANCFVCHKSSQRGVALSIPRGPSAHTTCFQCHTAEQPIGSCSVCHAPGRPVRISESAKAFRLNFSHQEHLRTRELNCSSCHSVRAGAARGRQVSSPLASMHFAPSKVASCAACHNGKRAFGAGDFANCRRCHQGQSFRF